MQSIICIIKQLTAIYVNYNLQKKNRRTADGKPTGYSSVSFYALIIVSGSSPLTYFAVTITFFTLLSEGSSYIGLSMMPSTIDLRPLAPVFLSMARCAISRNASSSNSSSIPSSSKFVESIG